ncbi:hypothetical protein GT347_25140 [Xylophilus rhododendri]|uniref:Uncharacterized protein n=1 Tax=Xylophilus rhododendri TaxID=2697032 RepID=A0A857JAF8_9BURK|nr:type VI secretion system tube protein Hcp [Xylophilus rhododendri]QHJ00985.1 hypothetical protein GT347_25140 [Xylophilus rhododendri]
MAENARLFLMLTAPSGAIKGESLVAGKRDWIEIDDWNWKLDPSSNKDDPEAIRPSVLSFTKTMDRSTTAMLSAMRNGTELSASIQMEDASLRLFDLRVRLDKVRILSYEMSTQISEKRLAVDETWTFDYDTLLLEYQPDLKSGAMQVRLTRPPGSSTERPDDTERKFKELSQDMSVQDLARVWAQMTQVRAESMDVQKAMEARKAKAKADADARTEKG